VDALEAALLETIHDTDVSRYGVLGRRKVEARFRSEIGARVLVDELRRRYG
jgi:hypothetical protein